MSCTDTKVPFSPGPWRSQWIGGNYRIEDADGHSVAFTNSGSKSSHAVKAGITQGMEQQLNAQLIAAAPELLEVLEAVEAQAQDAHDWQDLQCFMDDPETRSEYEDEYNMRRKIRDAIAKAKGA